MSNMYVAGAYVMCKMSKEWWISWSLRRVSDRKADPDTTTWILHSTIQLALDTIIYFIPHPINRMSNLTCFSRITEIHEDFPSSKWIGSIPEESPVGPEPMVSGVFEPVCIAGVVCWVLKMTPGLWGVFGFLGWRYRFKLWFHGPKWRT